MTTADKWNTHCQIYKRQLILSQFIKNVQSLIFLIAMINSLIFGLFLIIFCIYNIRLNLASSAPHQMNHTYLDRDGHLTETSSTLYSIYLKTVHVGGFEDSSILAN